MNSATDHTRLCVQDAGNLRRQIEALLARHTDRECGIAALRYRPSAYASSHLIDELDIELNDGSELRLIAKRVGVTGLLAEARRSRPSFLQHATCEAELYRKALQFVGDNVPKFYGSMCIASKPGSVVVLERVPGLELRRVGDLDIWRQAAENLGTLQTRITHRLALLPAQHRPPLVTFDDAYYWRWLARAEERVHPGATTASVADTRRFRRIARNYDSIVEHLASQPRVGIHGDCFPSNVLVEVVAGRSRVCFVDWEMAALGPGLMDVAALTAGAWTDREREELLAAYRIGLLKSGGKPASLDDMRCSLACCQLHLAIQMLGWSMDWEPPSEQRQDWLCEALQAATRLALL